MKNLNKKLIIIALMINLAFITSCNDDNNIDQQVKIYELKFQNEQENKSLKNTKNDTQSFDVKINTLTNEISFDETKLILKDNVKHIETGEKSFVLIIKDDSERKIIKNKSTRVPEIEIRRGFYFDGRCFIYGAYYYYAGSTEPFLFAPASLTAQVISNECGDYA